MRAHRKAQLAEQLAARTWWQDGDDLVFLREDGAPMHTDTPTALMPKLIAAAGLPHTRVHDLRHLHTRRPSCSPVCPCTWSRLVSVTLTRRSPGGSTRM